jgi:hypothetical protein
MCTYTWRNRYFLVGDLLLVPFGLYLGFVLRLDRGPLGEYRPSFALAACLLAIIIPPLFYGLGTIRGTGGTPRWRNCSRSWSDMGRTTPPLALGFRFGRALSFFGGRPPSLLRMYLTEPGKMSVIVRMTTRLCRTIMLPRHHDRLPTVEKSEPAVDALDSEWSSPRQRRFRVRYLDQGGRVSNVGPHGAPRSLRSLFDAFRGVFCRSPRCSGPSSIASSNRAVRLRG